MCDHKPDERILKPLPGEQYSINAEELSDSDVVEVNSFIRFCRYVVENKKKRVSTLEILTTLRHKGAAWQSQDRAESMIMKLKTLLTYQEFTELSIAHSHYQIGEGATEFYDVINRLIAKYGEISDQLKKS